MTKRISRRLRARLNISILPLLLFGMAACSKHNDSTLPAVPLPANPDTMTLTGTVRYLALGDSYTIGTSVTEGERYPVQTAGLLRAGGINLDPPDIIATNGWTTANLLNAISQSKFSNNYTAVSLLIGVNNQYQGRSLDEYNQEFNQLLQRAIQYAGGRADHVFVLSVPDYSVTPFARGSDTAKIAAQIDAFNRVNKSVSDSHKVNYLDVTGESRKAGTDRTLIASDSLHFSGKEYAIWSSALAPLIKAALH
jgi:lysophospholipase L1-like esterase